jgi:hypothetical protein
MPDARESILAQIDAALESLEQAEGGNIATAHTRMWAAIERLAPPGSPYVLQARDGAASSHTSNVSYALRNALQALRADYEAGYLQTVQELLHGAVFDDFLTMATELLDKSYKDPAAVVAGSVLEEHVRQLARRNDIATEDGRHRPRSFEDLTVDLRKKPVFGEPQRKIITGWYALRTAAAHGRYDEVDAADVTRMIDGIRDFMVRYPA